MQFCQPVGRILVDAKLQVLAELLVKLLVVVLVLRYLLNQFHNLKKRGTYYVLKVRFPVPLSDNY